MYVYDYQWVCVCVRVQVINTVYLVFSDGNVDDVPLWFFFSFFDSMDPAQYLWLFRKLC